jgi:prepilin-type N-terminal cleavage/methylation domain-containing protein
MDRSMNQNRNQHRGFTLIELILVVVLISILAAVSLPMLMAGFTAFSQQQETTAIEREAMLALERISREVRMSTDFQVNGGLEFVRPGGQIVTISLNGDELVLEGTVLARGVGSFNPQGPLEHEGACYLRVTFTTQPNLDWQQVVYLRNVSSCDE